MSDAGGRPRPRPVPDAGTYERIAAWLEDAHQLLTSTGAHEGHRLTRAGRCVYCSCGKRVQGRPPGK